ncbi:hypothetical protein MMC24_007548 [Lignoscripta atroalba]|nr:hypothetical protein [Lignoscripta atroalba]
MHMSSVLISFVAVLGSVEALNIYHVKEVDARWGRSAQLERDMETKERDAPIHAVKRQQPSEGAAYATGGNMPDPTILPQGDSMTSSELEDPPAPTGGEAQAPMTGSGEDPPAPTGMEAQALMTGSSGDLPAPTGVEALSLMTGLGGDPPAPTGVEALSSMTGSGGDPPAPTGVEAQSPMTGSVEDPPAPTGVDAVDPPIVSGSPDLPAANMDPSAPMDTTLYGQNYDEPGDQMGSHYKYEPNYEEKYNELLREYLSEKEKWLKSCKVKVVADDG